MSGDASRPIAPASQGRSLTHLDVLAIALPITVSNATVPLIGFADAAVIGQLGEAHLLGAVALSATIFNFLYFFFGFLRMGTTGLTAQAVGAGDRREIAANLARPLLLALALGATLVALQLPIKTISLWLMGASQKVAEPAQTYITIRIWAAPAGLANFTLLGWFIGLGRATLAFGLQLLLNGLNIALAILFVLGFGWGVAGVASAALTAEIVAALVGLCVAYRELVRRGARASLYQITHFVQLRRLFAVSRDILIRTASLQIAFSFFAAQGARAGDLTLATNAVLLNLVMIALYMVDGFAYAAETLVGQSVGARQRERFRAAIRLSTQWAFASAVLLALLLWLAGAWLIDFITTSADVRTTARAYLLWAALIPITSVWCFQLDGIFIGATATATMRNMMLLSLAGYFAAWAVLTPLYANHGLWMAVHVLFILRAVTLGSALPALQRKLFGDAGRVA